MRECIADCRRVLRLALAVFALSLALRVCWALFAHVTPVSDFRGYDRLAWSWLTTGELGSAGLQAYRTPGYPGFLALVYAVFGHSWKAAAVVQAVVGAFSSGLLVVLASRMLPVRAATLAGLLYTLSPTALAYVPLLASENLAVPLLLGCLAALQAGRAELLRPAILASVAAGLLFGCLILVRPAGVFLAPALAVVAICGRRSARVQLAAGGVFLAAAVLVLAPWFMRNTNVGLPAATLSTTGGVNLWMGNNDLARKGGYCRQAQWPGETTQNMSEGERDRAYLCAATTWIAAHPGRYLSLCGVRLARAFGCAPDHWAATYLIPTERNDRGVVASYLGAETTQAVADASFASALRVHNKLILAAIRCLVAPLILLALLLTARRWRDYLIVTLPSLTYLLVSSLTYFQDRFRELSDPLLFIPLAALLWDIVRGTALVGRSPTRATKTLLAVLAVGATVVVHATGHARSWYEAARPTCSGPARVVPGVPLDSFIPGATLVGRLPSRYAWRTHSMSSSHPVPDHISGIFVHWGETLAGEGEEQWDERLAFLRRLGMDTVIVQFSVIEGTAYYSSRHLPHAIPGRDPTAALLTAADRAGFQVHLGVASDEQHWWKIPYQPADLPGYVAQESERNNAISRELIQLYGEHPSLAGIYLSHEIHLGDEWGGTNLPHLVRLFNSMADEVKRLAPRCGVSTAPFFSLRGTTQQYEQRWRAFLGQARLDILMLQDGVGCERHITVDNMVPYYQALARVCRETGVDLWSDLELFDLTDPAAATPERIATQLSREAPHVSKIVAYSLANLTPELAAALPGVDR